MIILIIHIIISYAQNIALIVYVNDGSHVRLRHPYCVYISAQRQYTAVLKMCTLLKWLSLSYILGYFCSNINQSTFGIEQMEIYGPLYRGCQVWFLLITNIVNKVLNSRMYRKGRLCFGPYVWFHICIVSIFSACRLFFLSKSLKQTQPINHFCMASNDSMGIDSNFGKPFMKTEIVLFLSLVFLKM